MSVFNVGFVFPHCYVLVGPICITTESANSSVAVSRPLIFPYHKSSDFSSRVSEFVDAGESETHLSLGLELEFGLGFRILIRV